MNPFAFLALPGPLMAALLFAASMAASYWAGDHNRNNAWLAKELLATQQAKAALEAEVARGEKASISFTAEYLAMESTFTKLEGKFNELRTNGPLVVYRTRVPGAGSAGALAGSDGSTAIEPPPAGHSAPPGTDGAALGQPGRNAGPDVSLSLGAVWLWNSALTGRDTPAGACSAADTAAPACALDAGLGLEAAFANHAENARLCAQDRLHHQRLIDYITAQPKPTTAP